MENNHEVTNEELARMIGEGFHVVDKKLTNLRMETQIQKVREALAMK